MTNSFTFKLQINYRLIPPQLTLEHSKINKWSSGRIYMTNGGDLVYTVMFRFLF